MAVLFRQLNFPTGNDLSAATVTSEYVDVRDMRNLVVVINTTGAPTGTLTVTHFYGLPQHVPYTTANGGKNWANNPFTVEQTFTPSGTAATYKHIINAANGMPCSAYVLTYTKTSGTGNITAIQQDKGSGSV